MKLKINAAHILMKKFMDAQSTCLFYNALLDHEFSIDDFNISFDEYVKKEDVSLTKEEARDISFALSDYAENLAMQGATKSLIKKIRGFQNILRRGIYKAEEGVYQNPTSHIRPLEKESI